LSEIIIYHCNFFIILITKMGCVQSNVTIHDTASDDLNGPALDVYTDVHMSTRAFTVRLGPMPMLNDRPMQLDLRESTRRMRIYNGRFKNGVYFKLLVPCTNGLTAAARKRGIIHIVALYNGDKFEKDLVGNYYIFSM
jgi:hypothetical protein